MAQTHQRPHLKATPRLQAVNGTAIQIIGQTEIQIDLIPDPVPVIIAENIPHKMIIGDEFLRLGGAILDLGNNSMTWFGRRWSMQRSHPITNDSFGPTTPMTGNAEIDRLVRNNSNLFSAKGEPIGDSQLEALSINTNSRPICQKAYRTRLTKRKIVEDSIAEMLRDDIIEPSSSPWASPILLVKKKDGLEHRFSIDFRRVNAVTERDQYPMANISEIFDLLGGSKIFSTLDLKSGYWQLPVAIKDRPKTAFRCHLGLFQCKRIPFGLCNAPAVFQRAMDKLLTGLIGVSVCVYLDDIIVFSKNMADHEKHLQCVFDRLRSAGLRLQPTKCTFGQSVVKLLGYLVSGEGIHTDPDKVQAIRDNLLQMCMM